MDLNETIITIQILVHRHVVKIKHRDYLKYDAQEQAQNFSYFQLSTAPRTKKTKGHLGLL